MGGYINLLIISGGEILLLGRRTVILTNVNIIWLTTPCSLSIPRYHHVPRHRWSYAEGNHCPRSINHENQNHRTPREEILRMDRRIHPRLSVHLPTDVDLQTGIRRVRPFHRAQEMLLSRSSSLLYPSLGETLLFMSLALFLLCSNVHLALIEIKRQNLTIPSPPPLPLSVLLLVYW